VPSESAASESAASVRLHVVPAGRECSESAATGERDVLFWGLSALPGGDGGQMERRASK